MADHLDPPAVAGLRKRDITDIYAFHPPGWGDTGSQDLEKLVLVLNVNPLSPAGVPQSFSKEAEYRLLVDTDGDAKKEVKFEFEFKKPKRGVQRFEFEAEGGDLDLEGKGTTDTIIEPGGGSKVFAGLRDDPFFFDLGVLLGTSTGGTDTFADTNVSSIVVEVPTSALTENGSTLGVWGVVKGSGQIDRMGRPAVSTVLIPSERKDRFNRRKPKKDVKEFRADVIGTLVTAFGRSETVAGAIADILLPDILTLDASLPTDFEFFNAGPVVLNGRNLDDDVIDAALRLVTGSDGATDGVGANDVAFLGAFPYLAPPH